ncbi:hypothetical protein [Streptomyces sp. NPDC056723]|uniref:hypothetical protein n=1 Tax=Streptomyces sp. NPDC056723 TaxID=3345925 RepID=UPI0036C2B760
MNADTNNLRAQTSTVRVAVRGVRASRKIERAGGNALRAPLEEHEHIVQEIDGGNDHGEDVIVNFTRNGKRTPYWIAIQVKSGFFWLPVMDPDGDPGWWGTFWIWAGVFVPSFGLKLLFIAFIRFAMDRIRKRCEVEMA